LKIQGGNPTRFYNNEGANNIGTFTDTINDEKVFGKQVEKKLISHHQN
jgi:hypothetical protein